MKVLVVAVVFAVCNVISVNGQFIPQGGFGFPPNAGPNQGFPPNAGPNQGFPPNNQGFPPNGPNILPNAGGFPQNNAQGFFPNGPNNQGLPGRFPPIGKFKIKLGSNLQWWYDDANNIYIFPNLFVHYINLCNLFFTCSS